MIRKILFVDDDRVIQIIAEQQLRAFADHFSLVFANDGLDAIKKLESKCFSLVCIDLIMPRMKGANLFAHIRSYFPDIPVIILSAKSKEEMQKLVPPLVSWNILPNRCRQNCLVKCIVQHLQKETQGGVLYFIDGQLLEVRVGMITGLDAAHIVFGWEDGTVFI